MIGAEVRSRIALARLMVAEELLDNLPGELGMRTALSRGYYGLFHSAQAALRTVNEKQAGRGLKHGTVARLVRRRWGATVGQLYDDAKSARRDADYEPVTEFVQTTVSRQLKDIRARVDLFCLEAERVLK